MKYTLREWKDELTRRFGDNLEDYKFVCPACGKVSSGKEFKEVGATPDDMYSNCIGRFIGKESKNKKDGGCDWAAYGLFGTLDKGDIVVTPTEGKEVQVFKMAEV